MQIRCRFAALASALALVLPGATVAQTSAPKAAAATAKATSKGSAAVERGRYLSKIAGCNDCHTPGYLLSAGKVPENLWLTGDTLGWRGPWGTTYASNLREKVGKMSEAQWLQYARTTELRPPMPWFTLREMTEADLRALYRFIVYLGPGGQPAPAYVPPDKEPPQPYVTFPAPPPK
jgi:mono/diheme cytochrome c family protein